MENIKTFDLLISFIITWAIGLLPPLLIRYVFLKKPLSKKASIITCILLWIFNIVIFISLGSESKAHGVLLLVAYVSYLLLTKSTSIKVTHKCMPIHNEFTSAESAHNVDVNAHNEVKNTACFNGWQRLWIIVSIIYIILVSAIAVNDFPRLPSEERIRADYSLYADKNSDFGNVIIDGVVIQKEHKTYLQYSVDEYNYYINKRNNYLIKMTMLSIFPCVAIYVLGLSFNWVCNGFRSNNEQRQGLPLKMKNK